MNKTFKTTLLVLGSVVLVAAVAVTGVLVFRSKLSAAAPTSVPSRYGNGMGNGSAQGQMRGAQGQSAQSQMGQGQMGAYGGGQGQMRQGMQGQMRQGQMGGYAGGQGQMQGQRGWQGRMGGYGGANGSMMNPYASNAHPLTLEQARSAVVAYVQSLNNPNLEVGEVMVFSNHAYAEIVEKDTGIGAMEVLVDPTTLQVSPEPGPNMMWNRKYSEMMGGTVGATNQTAAMPITPEQAVKLAQQFLDRYNPGLQASEDADPFYGYYTIHTLRNGKVVGMLSVNGYTGEVFLHRWHGNFIAMSGETK